MSGEVRIIPLARKGRELERFLVQSDRIYHADPLYVAPLLLDMRDQFSDRNPFFAHAEMQLFVAERDGQDVGRIAAILDRNHNEFHHDQAASFGYFESVNDPAVSGALFSAVDAWARERGMKRILGPLNPSTNNECGLLIDGFDSPAVLMMTYNPAYYEALVEKAGYGKAKDLLAFKFDVTDRPRERLERVSAVFAKRHPDIRVRQITRKSLPGDLDRIKEVYNSAWERNWGFVPMTEGEVDYMAQRLKPLLTEGLVWLAETEKEPAAFMLALPDFNQAIRPLKGRVLTPKVLGVIPYLLGWKRPDVVRLIALGIKRSFRGRGIEGMMFAEGLRASLAAGFRSCEASWTLEDNSGVHRLIDIFEGRAYKTYRVYEREL